MFLENNAIYPWLAGWMVFNIVTLLLVMYIAIRISLK